MNFLKHKGSDCLLKLSVIVPVFNVGYLVENCLDTLINQSYKNIEIIVINDGSTDGSGKYLNNYRKKSNIVIIDLCDNQGLGNARNIGICHSTGEYITFVDSDDWIDLDLYSELIKAVEERDADVAICGIKNEYTNWISSEYRYNYKYSNQIDSDMAIKLLSNYGGNNYRISPVVWNKIYRTSVIKNNRIEFLKNSYWEDDIFSFQVMLFAKRIMIVPSVNYHYSQRNGSITKDFSKKHIIDLIDSFTYLKSYLLESKLWNNNERYYRAYFDRAITSMINMLCQNEKSILKQKEYLTMFFKLYSEKYSIEDTIEYLDINRINRLFK